MVHRKNESNKIKLNYKDVESIIFGNYTSLSFADTKKKKNQNIDLNKKYLPNMGPLTKDDIFYYLFNIQNTLYNLNKTYLSKEYKDISRMVSKFINKVNFTYLLKLEKSFEMSLLKFSTILTKPSYEKLKKNIFKQYYQIEKYINEISNYTKDVMHKFSNELNNTSIFINIINSQTFFRVLSYYSILTNYMQSKIKKIKNFNLVRNLGNDGEDYFNNNFYSDNNILDDDYNFNEDIIDQQEKIADLFYDNFTELLISKPRDPVTPDPIMNNVTNYLNGLIEKSYEKCAKSDEKKINPKLPPIIFPLPILPFLQIRIIPFIYFKAGFIFNCYNERKEYGAFLNLYVQSEVSLSLELGFYIPGTSSPVELAICVGLKGVLGSGKIGLYLEYNLNQNQLIICLDSLKESFTLYFYIQYRFTIDAIFYTLHFEFYIVNERLLGKYQEEHKVISYKFLK